MIIKWGTEEKAPEEKDTNTPFFLLFFLLQNVKAFASKTPHKSARKHRDLLHLAPDLVADAPPVAFERGKDIPVTTAP